MRNPFAPSVPRTGSRRISFAAIAAALAINKPTPILNAQWTNIVYDIADVLGASNPKFNRKRFLLAAGAL